MTLHHRFEGRAGAPVLALPSSLGTTIELWDENVPGWAGTFRVLRFDQRGHGGSEAPPGPYSIGDLGRDFVSLLDELGIARVSFCGLSLGGATAMWLATHAPDRIDAVVLACTSPRFGEPSQWLDRAETVRTHGLESIADGVVSRWFTTGFAERKRDVVAAFRSQLVATPPEAYAACCEALARWDFRERLGDIASPTLVIAGADDTATPLADARLLADRIPGAKLAVVPRAAHLANVEQGGRFVRAVTRHLGRPMRDVA